MLTKGGFARVDLDQKELGRILQILPSTHARQNAILPRKLPAITYKWGESLVGSFANTTTSRKGNQTIRKGSSP